MQNFIILLCWSLKVTGRVIWHCSLQKSDWWFCKVFLLNLVCWIGASRDKSVTLWKPVVIEQNSQSFVWWNGNVKIKRLLPFQNCPFLCWQWVVSFQNVCKLDLGLVKNQWQKMRAANYHRLTVNGISSELKIAVKRIIEAYSINQIKLPK